jgi:prophage regulatory protein
MSGDNKTNFSVGFLRLPDVLKIFPVSRSRWFSGVASGEYCQPVRLSARVVAWKKSDIEALCTRLSDGGA